VADERATARRGTDGGRAIGPANRGVPDAGTPPGRPSGPGPGGSGGTPEAGSLPTTSLLVFQTETDSITGHIAETQRMRPEPETGIWRKTKLARSVVELVGAVKEVAAESRITTLGILAHGDLGGRLYIGNDMVDWDTIAGYRNQLGELTRYLDSNADVLILGCVFGADALGSAMLRELSKILPGRKIIGFNGINTVASLNPDKDSFVWDPEIFTSNAKDKDQYAAWQRMKKIKEVRADAKAGQAKIAKDGVIIKWPDDEQKKKPDTRLPGAKVKATPAKR
jgi:hypothetical protein